jgi:transposase
MPTFTTKEQGRLSVIKKAIKGEITNELAATHLQLSVRQIKRLKKKVRDEGDKAVIHQLKGKDSNHRITDTVKDEAVELLKENYADFKPTFASEKLAENHNIAISYQTARRWMTKEGLWKPRKQKKGTYRSQRPRKEHYGELQQFDGSYHLWLEMRFCDEQGEPIEMCLLAAVDDATGKITKAVFADNEGVIAVFTFWKEYVETKGKPKHIYADKFSTYKINHKKAVDNHELITQFQRAMRQLDVNLIPAHSPQAKGRIERLNKTLQDRLVKELRLANIATPEAAGIFLQEVFIPKYNKKFAVVAAKVGDAHTPLQKEEKENLNHIFSIHDPRKINNDFTIQFKNKWYQLQEIQPTTVRAKMTVIMETWLDGTIHIMLDKHELHYFILPEKPKKQSSIKQPPIVTTHKLNYKPPVNHPWRKYPRNSSNS